MSEKEERLTFPKGFLWGSATAAHQVEGNNVYSDWWQWEQKGGGKEPSNLACDHYRRFEEDFHLAKKLHQNAHRLSIEWARVEPEEGKFQEKELQHYKEVLASLRQKKMKVFLTLFHFTLPVWFADRGGFEKKENLVYFERFVNRTVKALGDLTDFWLTVNEPNIYVGLSYLRGFWPPQKRNLLTALRVYLNLAAAHKKAYQTIHRLKKGAKVGAAINISTYHQYGLFLGAWLTRLIKFLVNDSFYFMTRGTHDFMGVNYYFYHRISLADFSLFRKLNLKKLKKALLPERSDLGWPIYPLGIYEVVMDLKKYQRPIYITENGVADANDELRAKFIINHLCWLYQAIKEGIDIRGYFHWTLMDNYEWAFGFEPKFGLLETNFRTQKRKVRPSALVYAQICQENGFEI